MIPPEALAKIMPIDVAWLNFDFSYHLDGSFKDPEHEVREAVEIDPENLPAQHGRVHYKKDGEKWGIGFNIYREGADVWFQAFYRRGGLPPLGHLTDGGKNKSNGEPERHVPDRPLTSTATIERYPWLTCSCTSMFPMFAMSGEQTVAESEPSMATPQVVATYPLYNSSGQAAMQKVDISESWTSTATATQTETHNVQVGLEFSYTVKAAYSTGVPGTGTKVETSFSLGMNVSYGYEHTTTTTSSDEKELTMTTSVSVDVPPKSTMYITVIVWADEPGAARFDSSLELSGTMNGAPLSGEYLAQLLLAMPEPTNVTAGPDFASYETSGSIEAELYVAAEVYISDDEPEDAAALVRRASPQLSARLGP